MIIMLHGKGTDQQFLCNSYESKRRIGLKNSKVMSTTELEKFEISGSLGGGRTNDKTYILVQMPFPINQSIRKKKKIDIRNDPRIGD